MSCGFQLCCSQYLKHPLTEKLLQKDSTSRPTRLENNQNDSEFELTPQSPQDKASIIIQPVSLHHHPVTITTSSAIISSHVFTN